ncbi:Rft protein-domain-containing protein [Aspergillus undulatus]|uniref:Rft protein-domain-containing protein n=1 Tax=Aspergillus undulatus TaxID=1810928 RepID=UPI003CCCAA71
MSRPAENASSILVSAMSGTTNLIFVQLASRLFIFASNQLILRSLSPSVLGIAAQLELFLISILYFSRESIRAAIQRQPLQSPVSSAATGKEKDAVSTRDEQERGKIQTISSQSIVNMSYLSIGMGIITATVFAVCYLRFASNEVLETPHYHASVVIIAVASLIELSSEPVFAVVQQYMLYGRRATVEVSAAFLKSLVTCGISTWAVRYGHSLGALSFALGHLTYALAIFCGYFIFAFRQPSDWHFSLLLSRIASNDGSKYFGDRFSARLLVLSANVFFQSVVKYLLTQGDSMILAAMTSLKDQGIYSLASNYGGLLARILFQPVEESSRTIFSSLLSTKRSKKQQANITLAKAHLLSVMRVYMVIAVLIIPLGPSLAPKALHILGGRRWTAPDVDALLALYCYYIPFLAFNGIGEAFVSSTASPQELRKQAVWMGLFSACFALASYLFLSVGRLGAQGLVYANIVNMCVRIIWSFAFIRRYLQEHKSNVSFRDFSLRPQTYAAGAVAAVLLSEAGSSIRPHGDLTLFTIGGGYVLQV